MKGKNPNPFHKKRRERRCLGQVLAAAVMILCLTVAGTTTYTVALSQPEILAVEPGAVWQIENEAHAEAEPLAEVETAAPGQSSAPETVEPEAAQPQAADQAAEPETAQPEVQQAAQPEAAAPEAAQPETPAPETAQPETAAPVAEDQAALAEENTLADHPQALTLSLLEEENSPWNTETPALSAEDPLASRYEEAQAGTLEGAQPLLLTPDQVDELLASDRALGLTQENFLDWLLGSDQSFLRWLFELIFGKKEEYSGWRTVDGKTYYYDPNTHLPVTGIQTIDGKIYYFDGEGIQRDVTFGIDVSKYQPNVDWNKVKQAGAEFAIIRIGYRGYSTGALALDPMFETHLAGAQAAGLRVGVYIFSQAINEDEAREEAFACAYVLNGRKLDYPVYFDSEYAVPGAHTGRADKLTKAERTACAVAFCEEIKKWGYEPGVYASTSWYSTQLDFNALRSYNIWNAHYGIPGPRMDCALWQGTCEGRINGINGNVDINISYIG